MTEPTGADADEPVGVDAEEATQVRAVWQSLGLPGLVDLHVHFMPHAVLRKVWAFFDAVTMPDGGGWPISYRAEDEQVRLAQLRSFGVRAFPSLVYAHKPGMAQWLTQWALEFASTTPDCVPTLTFFPEPDAGDYVANAIANGARLAKVHLQVGAFDPRDPLLRSVWGALEDAGTVVVAHVGSGPMPGPFTGPGPIGEVLRAHPRLRLVIAHMGTPEYRDFLDLAMAHEDVWLDTTMAFTDFTERFAAYPRELHPRLRDAADRIVLGSDFPNVPYRYRHQLDALVRLDLGDDWLRAVLHDNGARLLGLPAPA